MDFDRNFIKNVIIRENTFCTLCLKNVNMNECISISDKVFFDKENNENMAVVLNFVLGSHISSNFLSSLVCLECSKSVLKSFSFIKMVRQNYDQISKFVLKFFECLEGTVEEALFAYKTMYFLKNKDEDIVTYFDNKSEISTKSEALVRFNTLTLRNSDIRYSNEFSIEILPCEDGLTAINTKKQKASIKEVSKQEILHYESSKNKLKCKFCSQAYPTITNLKRHFIRVHAPKIFKCEKCLKCYPTEAILADHNQKCHTDKNFICSDCGKTYKYNALKRHELTHQEKIKCDVCGKFYKTKTTYNKHIELNICGQFKRKSQSDAIFECELCKKKYCSKMSLKVHMRLEHEDCENYVCSWCDKKFSAKSRLKAHEVKHTGAKDFSCELCNKFYVSKESLLCHMKRHSGEKPYECSFCDTKFYSLSNRNEHVSLHHLEPRFECDICKIRFKRRSYLKKHMSNHNNIGLI